MKNELDTLKGKTVIEEIIENVEDVSVALCEINEKLKLIRELGVQDESMADALNLTEEAEMYVDSYLENNL